MKPFRSARTFLGCVLLIQPAYLCALESGKPAGVVAYSCVAGKQLVLLAYDGARGRHGWGSFGGSPASGAEPVHETASREFHEETGCVFTVPRAQTLSNLEYSVSAGFYTYVSEVPFVPAAAIEASGCGEKDRRSDWVWIDSADLKQALDAPGYKFTAPGYENMQLWDLARDSMVQAERDGILELSHDICE